MSKIYAIVDASKVPTQVLTDLGYVNRTNVRMSNDKIFLVVKVRDGIKPLSLSVFEQKYGPFTWYNEIDILRQLNTSNWTPALPPNVSIDIVPFGDEETKTSFFQKHKWEILAALSAITAIGASAWYLWH